MITKKLLLVGANGSIGKALSGVYRHAGWEVISISRNKESDLTVDLSLEESFGETYTFLQKLGCPDMVINCNGVLHDDHHMPERRLKDLNVEWLTKSFSVNLQSHINLAKALDNVLTTKTFTWVSLSAMVGSITDNYLGGWYSYRMSKASLNMFVKNLSIEWKRKNKDNRVFAIHPGTTKSYMSSPFKVKKDKIYQPELSAQRIYSVIEAANSDLNGQFLNWNGEIIPW